MSIQTVKIQISLSQNGLASCCYLKLNTKMSELLGKHITIFRKVANASLKTCNTCRETMCLKRVILERMSSSSKKYRKQKQRFINKLSGGPRGVRGSCDSSDLCDSGGMRDSSGLLDIDERYGGWSVDALFANSK